MPSPEHWTPDTVGYDPRPDVTHWKGNPIPMVVGPLPTSAVREEIARAVWWNGPPWTVLRNGPVFLWHVMDYGSDAHIEAALDDIKPSRWGDALERATVRTLSKGSYVLFSMLVGRTGPDAGCPWPARQHRNDIRPLANESRERMYERHQAFREKTRQWNEAD